MALEFFKIKISRADTITEVADEGLMNGFQVRRFHRFYFGAEKALVEFWKKLVLVFKV